MSGIAGLINLDAAPVPPDAIEKMLDAQAYRGPDARGVWYGGSVALGHDLLRTTPEATYETQPFSLDQTVWITVDGRLDNRDELINALKHTAPEPLDGVPDCHLMLLAYRHWDADFATHLIGDFALAIWDGKKRRLLCACDPLAVCSLYYTSDGHRLVFGSSIGAVLSVLGTMPAPNEVFIAQFLTQSALDGRTATFFEGVHRLAPTHLLIVETGCTRQRKYFEFGAGGLIRYSKDQEYVDHFRDLLKQALLSRLRSCTGVSIDVSGGLDSSSLACLANHLIATGQLVPAQTLTAFCMTTQAHPEMDERRYQNAVVERCEHLQADFYNTDSFWSFKSFGADGGYPFHQPELHPMRSSILGTHNRIRERGERVAISGAGSDAVNGRLNGYIASTAWRDLPWRERVAEWRHFRREHSIPTLILDNYVKPVVRPLLPETLRKARYARFARQHYPHLNRQWLLQVYRDNANDQEAFQPELPTRAARAAYDSDMCGWECIWRACTDTTASYAQVEMRYPYHDRRLIDFMLQVPTRMLIHRGWDKWILREAIGELLPRSARYQRFDVDTSGFVNEGLRETEKRRIMELLSGSCLVKRGWATNDAWQSAWQSYWDGTMVNYATLVAGISVEAWLRLYTR